MILVNDVIKLEEDLNKLNKNNVFDIKFYSDTIKMKITENIDEKEFTMLSSTAKEYKDKTFTFEIYHKKDLNWKENINGQITVYSGREVRYLDKDIFNNYNYFIFLHYRIKSIIRKCNK